MLTHSAKVFEPIEDGVENIVRTSRATPPEDVIKAVLSGEFNAVIIPPTNRQKFIQAVNQASFEEMSNIKERCEYYAFNGTHYVEFNHDTGHYTMRVSAKDINEISPLYKYILRNAGPFAFHYTKKEKCIGAHTFIAEVGKLSELPEIHEDDFTVHHSIRGAPLEFLAGEFDANDINKFNKDGQRDPQILSKLRSVEQGDTVVFNEGFWHRSSHKARELGQFSIAYY